MICKVKSTIEKHGMFVGVKSVAVGLSGGADSMSLIDILSRIKGEYDITLKAVHINHNIRGVEAQRDADFVKNYCEIKGIELLLFNVDVPVLSKQLDLSEEECGRRIRYECFEKAGCDVIATAHTMSDSVETVIFNLVRGSGSKGLAGIPAKRNPNIVRPLIDCTRAEIENYCLNNNIDFVTDSSNLTDAYRRNYIRHNIIPAFSEINPSSVNSIIKTAEILNDESDFIEQCADELINSSLRFDGYSIDVFLSAHSAVRKRAIRILLSQKMSKSVEHKHVVLSEKVIRGITGKAELSDGLYILAEGDVFSFRNNDLCSEEWCTEVVDGCFISPYFEYKLTPTEHADGIDLDKVENKLTVSSRRGGDRIYIKKRNVTKSLKKAFNELKVPPNKRNEYAVLRDGENIVWVEGIGTDGKYLPDDKSVNVFFVKKGCVK